MKSTNQVLFRAVELSYAKPVVNVETMASVFDDLARDSCLDVPGNHPGPPERLRSLEGDLSYGLAFISDEIKARHKIES
jgi:hypothetical protein